MTGIELLLLAISLCFDTFAVSLGGGLSLSDTKFSKKAVVMAFFAFFQAALLCAGWMAGSIFASYIMKWDHWIAFSILLYIGGKMIVENIPGGFGQQKSDSDCSCKKNSINLLNYRTLVTLSIATSIDAVAVGVSLALVSISALKMCFATVMTFIFTALASYTGLAGGEKIGCRIGAKATVIGGAVLIAIGIKILLEHIFL
ncbi:MAG: manganese efflux pump [Bacteroidales bacterium]|nr:manganese efflux pump [Bacteroidales bacterium]